MIGYTMIGTNDLEKSLRFYDPLMAAMDLDQCWRDEQSVSWGKRADESIPRLFVGYPFDGEAATVGNGSMTAFLFDNAGIVDRLHALAMQNGGSDEGAPGPRPHYGAGFYGAYARDPDGNKLAFVCYNAG